MKSAEIRTTIAISIMDATENSFTKKYKRIPINANKAMVSKMIC